ncbi:unnamed protein product [Acidithrix sp. C25]|nr:unnamed protein product [Acidithrix sp. C25]
MAERGCEVSKLELRRVDKFELLTIRLKIPLDFIALSNLLE